MSSRPSPFPVRMAANLIVLACALGMLPVLVSAQANQPKDEVFGGYSWLHPNGYGDRGYRVLDIVDGFDISNTYYLPAAHDLGILIDGSGHFHGSTNPINPVNNGTTGTSVGYILGGLQYKYHGGVAQPFVRAFVGTANMSPDCCSGTRWSGAVGGGGGLDLAITPRFSIRVAQVDYIHSSYIKAVPSVYPAGWNSVRLAAGVVISFGSYYSPPLSCAASATPAEVWAGEPVRVTTAGTNFNPKHPVTYAWTVNGGKLSSANTQASDIDTAGMAPGSYAASSTIADPKMRKMNSATCSAPFGIKQPHPPEASCSANPAMIAAGQSSTITMTASSPDGLPLTYAWSATGGQLSGSGSTATLTATNPDAGTTITVTGTVSDGRNPPLTATCTAVVNVSPPQKCISLEDWGMCTFDKDAKRPARVDNECKDVLDKLSLRLQQMSSGQIVIVGYADEQEMAKEPTLGAQRSANIKYYLTTEGSNKIDTGRVQVRQGGSTGKMAHFYFLAEGTLCAGQVEEGTAVNETEVQGQPRKAPAPKKKSKAKPAQGQ
jgi:outer membrane protein OmpA-like peptidoglycan-associated protein